MLSHHSISININHETYSVFVRHIQALVHQHSVLEPRCSNEEILLRKSKIPNSDEWQLHAESTLLPSSNMPKIFRSGFFVLVTRSFHHFINTFMITANLHLIGVKILEKIL